MPPPKRIFAASSGASKPGVLRWCLPSRRCSSAAGTSPRTRRCRKSCTISSASRSRSKPIAPTANCSRRRAGRSSPTPARSRSGCSWASTGTKDPSAPDTLYVTALAAPDTINTMPDKTLRAFADHGRIEGTLPDDGGDCEADDRAHRARRCRCRCARRETAERRRRRVREIVERAAAAHRRQDARSQLGRRMNTASSLTAARRSQALHQRPDSMQAWPMSERISDLAGKPAPKSILVDVPKLLAAYADLKPDPRRAVAARRVRHVRSSRQSVRAQLQRVRTFSRSSQAICEYRSSRSASTVRSSSAPIRTRCPRRHSKPRSKCSPRTASRR